MLSSIELGYNTMVNNVKSFVSLVTLPILEASPSDTYYIKGVSGLGPPEIDIAMSNLIDGGSLFQNKRYSYRQLTMVIGINPNYQTGESIDILRSNLYKLLNPQTNVSDKIAILLKDTIKPDRYVEGYIETFESTLFNKDSAIQISIVCPSPYIFDFEDSKVISNNSLIYTGNIPSGFNINISSDQDIPPMFQASMGISLTLNDEIILGVGIPDTSSLYPLLRTDIIEFNTKDKEKSIYLIRSSSKISLLQYSYTDWPKLYEGQNVFAVENGIINSIGWTNTYVGV